MSAGCTILLLEDEPLILMDLEFAGEDRNCRVFATPNCTEAMKAIASEQTFDVAVLDGTLAGGETCAPVAEELQRRGVPILLHSGDLDRNEERVRLINAPLIAKPASAEKVIAAAIALFESGGGCETKLAAE